MYITKRTPTDIPDNHADYHYEIWNDDGTPFDGDLAASVTEYAYELQGRQIPV